MKLFYAYKKDWDHYIEDEGVIVTASTWQRAKGIAMANSLWAGQSRSNIEVKEIDVTSEAIICFTNGTITMKKEEGE